MICSRRRRIRSNIYTFNAQSWTLRWMAWCKGPSHSNELIRPCRLTILCKCIFVHELFNPPSSASCLIRGMGASPLVVLSNWVIFAVKIIINYNPSSLCILKSFWITFEDDCNEIFRVAKWGIYSTNRFRLLYCGRILLTRAKGQEAVHHGWNLLVAISWLK